MSDNEVWFDALGSLETRRGVYSNAASKNVTKCFRAVGQINYGERKEMDGTR